MRDLKHVQQVQIQTQKNKTMLLHTQNSARPLAFLHRSAKTDTPTVTSAKGSSAVLMSSTCMTRPSKICASKLDRQAGNIVGFFWINVFPRSLKGMVKF